MEKVEILVPKCDILQPKCDILQPKCDILQGGLVLVDIPGFIDPNPVRKDIAEKV